MARFVSVTLLALVALAILLTASEEPAPEIAQEATPDAIVLVAD